MKGMLTRKGSRWTSLLVTLVLLVSLTPLWVTSVNAAPNAAPSISVSPASGLAGSTVTVIGSGFTEGFNAAIRWDGVDQVTFTMPKGGSFSSPLKIPSGAAPGPHTISVCNYCGGGEFEETASTGFKVTTPPPSPTFTPRPPTSTFTSVPPTYTFTAVPPTHTTTPPPILFTPRPPTIIPPPSLLESGLFEMGPDFGIALIELHPFMAEEKHYRENMIGARFEGPIQIARPSISPYSGEFALRSIVGESGSAMQPIRMIFSLPIRAIGMYVGIEEGPSIGEDVTATLIVFGYQDGDLDLIELGTDSIVFPTQPADIIYPLHFVADEGDVIVQAILEYTDSEGKSVSEARWMDDLILVFYAGVELPEELPPGVYLLSSEDGSKITSTEDDSPIHESAEDRISEGGELAFPGEVFVDQLVIYGPDCTPNQATFSALISDPAINPGYVSLLFLPPGDSPTIGIEMEKSDSGVYKGTLQLNEDSPSGDWTYSVILLDESGVSFRSEEGTISVKACIMEASESQIRDQLIGLIPYLAIGFIVLSIAGLAGIAYLRIRSTRDQSKKVINPQSAEGGSEQESTDSTRRTAPPSTRRPSRSVKRKD
ncbi:MAG: hypothetical protein GTO18_12900 [Anaerolineales bacterium]|nr:hypothetical protein [Anaerolineales bacterium]